MSLLTLPTELRHMIYSNLIQPEYIHWPFVADSPIIKLSHKPPPSALLRACRFLNEESLSYYYSIVTIQIMALGFACINIDSTAVLSMNATRRVKKVEMLMVWNNNLGVRCLIGPKDEWHDMRSFEMQMIRKLNEEAKCLERLVVVVLDRAGEHVAWEIKETRLVQLREVKEGVRIEAGRGLGVHDVEYKRCLAAEKYIEEMNAERG